MKRAPLRKRQEGDESW